MRNGVMNMEQVQVFPESYLRHLGSQRQGIRRIIEKGIVEYLNLVKINVLDKIRKTVRESGGYEMDFVAAAGKVFAQLRRHRSTPSIGRITGDSDIHKLPLLLSDAAPFLSFGHPSP
jgi:hypothetical protein